MASMQSFTVSESVNGLFFFAEIHETRREAAAALSWDPSWEGRVFLDVLPADIVIFEYRNTLMANKTHGFDVWTRW